MKFSKHLLYLFFALLSVKVQSQFFHDTKGSLDIANSGAATYTVQIAMPPSIKNVAPQINLTYNSAMRGGIAGQGWSMSGISNISRIATRRDIDGFVDGVDFDNLDKLALDGQRLLLKSGNYWENGSTYMTEYKSNQRIELKIEGSAYGPQTYFIVTQPDGFRTWYGSTGNGVIQNATSANAWYIIRSEDNHGNFITYNYAPVTYNGTSQLYIDNIKFSGNESLGLAQVNEIHFYYEDAQRVERDFVNGYPTYCPKILLDIQVLSNNELFRLYQFNHVATDLGYDRTTSVQEFNGMGEASNAVFFGYDTTPNNVTRTETYYANNINFDTVETAGDFDGDGRLDFTAGGLLYTNLFNGGVGNPPIGMPSFTGNLRKVFAATTLSSGKMNQFQSIVYAEPTSTSVNLKIYNLNGSSFANAYTKTIALSNVGSKVGSTQCLGSYTKDTNQYFEGDFNGDGISEVLIKTTVNERKVYNYRCMPAGQQTECSCHYVSTSNDGYTYHLLNLDPNASTTLGSAGFLNLQYGATLLDGEVMKFGDFNGDGKTDILSIKSNGTYNMVSFSQITTSPYVQLELIGQGYLDEWTATKQLLLGDFNGDGRTDVLLPDTEGDLGHTYWLIYFANTKAGGGEAFRKEGHIIAQYWPTDSGHTYQNWNTYYAIDIDKDGKSDLVECFRQYSKTDWTINDHDTTWHVAAYTNLIGNSGTSSFVKTYDSPWYTSGSPDIPVFLPSNYRYQGQNTELVMIRSHYNAIEYYQFNKDAQKDNRITSISEVAGKIVHNLTYSPIMAGNGGLGNIATDIYSSSNSVSYPNVEIIKNTQDFVVSKLQTTINGISKYQDFRYHGLISNFNLGTFGFKRVARSSWYISPGETKIWTIMHNEPSLRGANTLTWTTLDGGSAFNTVPSNLLDTKTNVFATYTNPTTKLYNVLLTQQSDNDAFTNVRTETNYTYDGTVDNDASYGVETDVTTSYYNNTVLNGTSRIVTSYEHNPTGTNANYYVGRPKQITKTNTVLQAGGNDTMTSEIKYTYTNLDITKTEKKGHNTDYLSEDNTYDALGNILTTVTSAPTAVPAVASRTVTNVFDPSKRFVISKTDISGFVTLDEYNPMGQLKKSIDHLGYVKEFKYDNWGKLTETKLTNSTVTPVVKTISYFKMIDGGYMVKETCNDNSEKRTRYNASGDIIQNSVKGLTSGTWQTQDFDYDAYGRKYRESLPYSSGNIKYSVFSYDVYHRLKRIDAASERVSVISYSGLTTTTIDDGQTYTVTLDALGNKIQTTDPGGTIDFRYYANGMIKETLYGDHKITTTIDGWGNKKSMFDPNCGDVPFTYDYDAFGQLLHENSPKGTISNTYDGVGKLINKKIVGDGTDIDVSYRYNSYGQLLSETNNNTLNVDYSYTYHPTYHNLTGTRENNALFDHTTTLTFDNIGRQLTKTIYTKEKSTNNVSSTVVFKNVYSPNNGTLYKITDASDNLLWQLNTVNAKKQHLSATYGNGVNITNVYNDNYYLTSQSHLKNTTSILNNTYNFDVIKGQLLGRTNNVFGITEAFEYYKDRLKTWTNPADNTIDSNEYDDRGRITANNKLGAVNYITDPTIGLYKKNSISLNATGLYYYKINDGGGTQTISYTMFKAPISINNNGKGKMDFYYNTHLTRTKMDYDYGTIAPSTTKVLRKTKLYTDDGTTEIIYDYNAKTIQIRTFIGGDAYTSALFNEKIVNTETSVSSTSNYYLHRDYLGSVLAITNNDGNLVEKRLFDAWGNLAKITDGNNVTLDPANGLIFFDRGYTGHEHLQEVKLINMNGRLYDPVLRSFLMPDNNIQSPENTQNYNRFSYVMNNPLKYTDRTGEFWGMGEFASAVVIGAVIAAASYTVTTLVADVPFSVGGLLKSTVIGAASGAITFGIGSAATSLFTNFYSQAAFQAVAHGTIQGTMSAASGGKFWSGFAAGAISSIASSAWGGGQTKVDNGDGTISTYRTLGLGKSLGANNGVGMVAFGTVSGGAAASIAGGNFWQGAISGFVVSGLNHYSHLSGDDSKPWPKYRLRHILFGPDAIYVAFSEDLGIGIGAGFEQGAIIILRGEDAGIYPALDFGVGVSSASGSIAVEAVSLYYTGDKVTKDVFYGNRYEFNFGADFLGKVGLTAVYAPVGNEAVFGSGLTLGLGFSATFFSGNINYGRTQTSGNQMIPNLVKKK